MNLKLASFDYRICKQLLKKIAICLLFFINHQLVDAVPVNTDSYKSSCGVSVKVSQDILILEWDTPEGSTQLSLNISGEGALVRSIAVASGDSKPVVVLRDADPITVISIGQRDLKKRGGWNIFFDPTSRKLSKSGPLTLKLKSVFVRSEGNRCIVEIDELTGSTFSGNLRFYPLRGL